MTTKDMDLDCYGANLEASEIAHLYPRLEPEAKRMIDEAKKDDILCMMMVDWFQTDDEALILKDLLWYARDNWVPILMTPEPKTNQL